MSFQAFCQYINYPQVYLALDQVFLVLVWNFEPYMLPLTLLVLLLKNVLLTSITATYAPREVDASEYEDDEEDFDGDDDGDKVGGGWGSEQYLEWELWSLGICEVLSV